MRNIENYLNNSLSEFRFNRNKEFNMELKNFLDSKLHHLREIKRIYDFKVIINFPNYKIYILECRINEIINEITEVKLLSLDRYLKLKKLSESYG